MSVRFFNYSGSKVNYSRVVNKYIDNTRYDIYVEPFVGSGAILFNLRKNFKKYIINDFDNNIIKIYNAFREITYVDLVLEYQNIIKRFGPFTYSKTETPKDNFYRYRQWFNDNLFETNTVIEGVHIYFLSNMVINSMLRFGPNGMNSAFGDRTSIMSFQTFEHVNNLLQRCDIYCTDYTNIIDKYPRACYFLDPPYFSQDAAYSGFTLAQYKNFIKVVDSNMFDYVYTDIQNEYNKHLNGVLIRDMRNTCPSSDKSVRGNKEYLYSNITKTQDW